MRVLLVEDNNDDALLIEETLAETAVEIERAERLSTALAELAKGKFDAVLLDLSLPDAHGLDTIGHMLSQARGVPIVVLTGLNDEETAVKAVEQGAQDYLIKGQVDGSLLTRALRYAIERKRAEKALQNSEQHSRLVIETAGDAFIGIDAAGIITDWNRRAEVTFGWSRRDAIGRPLTETIIPLHYREAHKKGIRRFLATGEGVVFNKRMALKALHRDGHEFPVELMIWPIREEQGYSFNAFIRDVTEQERAKEQIQYQRQRLEALHEINLSVSSTLELRSMLDLLLEKIDLVLPNAVTTIRLINKETGILEPVACRNIDEPSWRSAIRKEVGGLAKIVLENKTSITIPNIQTDPRSTARFAKRFGLVSYLGVPLIAKDEVLGLIAFFTREAHSFGDEEIDFLTTLAGQSATAIHNAKLYEEIRRSASELSALHSLTTAATQSLNLDVVLKEAVKKITEFFHFDATRIYLFNQAMDELHVRAAFEVKPEFWTQVRMFARGQGIVGRAVERGESFIFEDIRHDPRYEEMSHSKTSQKNGTLFLAMLPIKTKLRAWGAMACAGENPRKLKMEEVRLLTSMTNQIAIAVENAMLYQQTATKAKELAALYSIAGVASEFLDTKVVLRKTMDKVLEIFRFDAGRIYLRHDDTRELRLVLYEGLPEALSVRHQYELGEGLVEKVGETGEPLFFADMQTDAGYDKVARYRVMRGAGFRGSFFIPIRLRGETLGVMNFLSKEPHEFSESDVRLINSIAHHLGIAVENANLFSQLRQKTVELEKANKTKNEFLGVISHELRTPLNVIKGYTELVKDRALGEITSAQERALGKITQQSRDLLSMINDVLQATLIEAGATKVVNDELNLCKLIDQLRSNYDFPLGKNITLNWDYPSDLPVVKTDEEKLKATLQNLINNALKFTEKGTVTISVRHDLEGGLIEIRIMDTGIGIPKESIRTIFDMFQQVDSSAAREYGGVGLGLYIVKKFTELLGGRVAVTSELGKGSCFTVTIPAVQASIRPHASEPLQKQPSLRKSATAAF